MSGAAGGDVMDAWSTTTREFKSGSELLAPEAAEALTELHASFQLPDGNGDTAGMLGVDMETFVRWLRIWPEDQEFCAQDLTLHTHVNGQTGDSLFYWNYGLGDNDYGSYHFLLAGQPRSSAVHVMTNMDGDLSFLGPGYDKFADAEAWPKPESDGAREAWARQVVGLIKFYRRVEEKLDCDEGSATFKKTSTPVDVGRFPKGDDDDPATGPEEAGPPAAASAPPDISEGGGSEASHLDGPLRWVAELTVPDYKSAARNADAISLSNEGRTFRRVPAVPQDYLSVFGTPLPTTGASTFSVRVENAFQGMCLVAIGVARADGSLGWGVYLRSGKLLRRKSEDGNPAPLPRGWPDGYAERILPYQGRNVFGSNVNGGVLDVCLDHDAGTLGFRLSGGPLQPALSGFPPGAALRPWVCFPSAEEQAQISFV